MGKRKRILLLFAALVAVYALLVLLTPTDPGTLTRFGLSESQAQALKVTVVVPYALIWFTAFLGYAHLKHYTDVIQGSKDGKSFAYIAQGLFVLALSLPLLAIVSSASSYVGRHNSGWIPALTIFNNYLSITLGLIAFGLIYKGMRSLVGITKVSMRSSYEYLFMAGFIALGFSFIFMTLGDAARQFPVAANGRALYYLPDALIVLTIIIPQLLMWFMGIASVYGLLVYRQNVKGVIYRSALGSLAAGIAVVIFSRIAIRYTASFTSLSSATSLRTVLLIIYCFLILSAAGYLFIVRGARRLKKLEEA